MISPENSDAFINIDMNTVDTQQLTDISTLEFDISLSKEQRISYVLEMLKNPFCFRYGKMGIKLEFDHEAPTLNELLTDFLIRNQENL